MVRRLLLIGASVLIIAMMMPTAFADEEIESVSTQEDGAIADENDSGDESLTNRAEQSIDLDINEGDYVSMQAFSSDHYLMSLISKTSESFLTDEWDVKDARLTLSFSTTQLADEMLSDITISINGVRFYSERIPSTDGLRRELQVKIPVEHIISGYNIIHIEGYIRTRDGLPCVDDVTASNWMNIFEDSFVEIVYEPFHEVENLAEFYRQFTSIDAMENKESAIVIQPDFDSDEMDAALTILSGVSRNAQLYYENLDLIIAGDMHRFNDYKYVIYVAKCDNLLPTFKAALDSSGISCQEDEGKLLLLPGTPNVLLVTGSTHQAMDNGAKILSDANTMLQLHGSSKTIFANEDLDMRQQGVGQYTQLTTSGTYIKGVFRQKADYYIDFPSNRKLAYGSEVSLSFRYAENLDFDRSLVTVYINNVPIGSQKLSQARAENDIATFTIPTDIHVVGAFTVTVAFDLEIKDLWCTIRQPETPWAYVSQESMLKLNGTDVPYFLFENYPYPFVASGAFNHTLLILPDENRDVDVDAIAGIMRMMGRYLKFNTGEFDVVRASDEKDMNGKNLIIIGTYEHPMVAPLNGEMFFKFYPDGEGIMSNEKMLIEHNYGTTLGTAQLLESPYSKSRNAIMLVTGANADGLSKAAYYLSETTASWKIYGDGYVADDESAYPYRFKQENEKKEPLLDEVEQRASLFRVAYVAGGVLAIILVAAVTLMIKYRREQNHE